MLAGAYRRLFSGKGSQADAEIVLADLANMTGFYRVTPPGDESWITWQEGKRAVYGHIFRFIRMSPEELEALETAARQEAIADEQEGEI